MNTNPKSHLWIPEEEVNRIDKKITARSKERNVSFAEHGLKLSHSLQAIKDTLQANSKDNSLSDVDVLVFNVELPEGEKIQDKKDLFTSNGLNVRAVRNVRNAIVTSTRSQFQALSKRINAYSTNGSLRTYFDFVENFSPFIGSEKDSSELKRIISATSHPDKLDVQLMLLPNLESDIYGSALKVLAKKIVETGGEMQEEPYFLSDDTPVIRAIIPASTLQKYENDTAIYRIEETDFFSADASDDTRLDIAHFALDQSVNISELAVITVLDSGVAFPENLKELVVYNWIAPGSQGGNSEHGTKVASRAVFKYVGQRIPGDKLVPRARVVDCNILDGRVPVNILISRIQAAVEEFSEISKLYNLSANAQAPIEGDEMSILGYELDALQLRKGVQFFVSAGNHNLWRTESTLEDILDDDDSRISAPADSMLSVAVGAVVGFSHEKSLSTENQIAPYSRRGPGFRGLSKPDLVAYSGTVILESGCVKVPQDEHAMLINREGTLTPDAGTSFSAPIVAGDCAEILSILPNRDILLAKALLFHNAKPLWDSENMDDSDLAFAHNLCGRGVSNVDDSKFSSPSRVTFVRTGSLNRTTKERVKIYMPEILAAQVGRNVARVTVTCVSMPPVDRTKGTEYLGAYIRASLKKSSNDGVSLKPVSQEFKEGRQKWDICHQFSRAFSKFDAGDWQIWLELFSRWDDRDDDVPYALVVTIEDVSGTLDVYSEIEALNRFRPLNTLRIRIDN